ncbi:MAG: accessory gene regulator B family protein [Lachnospiraceae bacterium]|nr:accessory gene regulator B family protein [Lachnospiraceae bacterium]
MIHRLAKQATLVLISGNVAKVEEEDIYTYAFENIISTTIHILLCLMLSTFFGLVIEGVVFMVCFALLRRFAGGHHAKQHWSCIITFAIIFNSMLIIISLMPIQIYSATAILASLISVCIIYNLAPVEHENKPIYQGQQKVLRIKSRILVSVMSLIVIIGMFSNANSIFLAIALSMMFVTGSMTYAKHIKRKVVMNYEEPR